MSFKSCSTSSFMSVSQVEVLTGSGALPSADMKVKTGTNNSDTSQTDSQPTHHQKSGYLLKKGTMGLFSKRFFEINGEYLLYYKNRNKRKLLEAISITGAANIRIWEAPKTKNACASSLRKSILIDMRDRQYLLVAETVEDCTSWINEFLSIRETESLKNKLIEAVDTVSFIDDLDGRTRTDSGEGRSVTRARRDSEIENERKDFLETITSDDVNDNDDKWDTIITSEDINVDEIKISSDSVTEKETAETRKTISIADCFGWLCPETVDKKSNS